MSYSRRIIHYSPGPTDLQGDISLRAVAGCWFELHRQGGCGPGEFRLRDDFLDRYAISPGDWIAFDYDATHRWYLGRVRDRRAKTPAGVTFRLEGMSVQLDEVFPGGPGPGILDGISPHRYAATDLFLNDPDYLEETVDVVHRPYEAVRLMMTQYAAGKSNILFDASRVEQPLFPSPLTSMKFRGEESLWTIFKDLATRSRNASWGVDEQGEFFFLRPRTEVAATFREGRDLISLEATTDRDRLFNRIILTGGIVYDEAISDEADGQVFYQWNGIYVQPASRTNYGERCIRISVPWIRTREDSREFAREFFRIYANPTERCLVDVMPQSMLPKPWDGSIRIEDRSGNELITNQVEAIRVYFDHAPKLRMEIGPRDPRELWPESPAPTRHVLPHNPSPEKGGGDLISLTSDITSDAVASSSEDYGSSSDVDGSSSETELLLLDTFTDADGTSIDAHTMDIGDGWTILQGEWKIQSNQLVTAGTRPPIPHMVAIANAHEADVEVTVDLNIPSGGFTNAAILLRVTDVDNLWLIDLYVGGQKLRLHKRAAGTWYTIDEVTKDLSTSQTYTLTATATGQNIVGTLNDGGPNVGTNAATLNQSITTHGIRADDAGYVFDNFRAHRA